MRGGGGGSRDSDVTCVQSLAGWGRLQSAGAISGQTLSLDRKSVV